MVDCFNAVLIPFSLAVCCDRQQSPDSAFILYEVTVNNTFDNFMNLLLPHGHLHLMTIPVIDPRRACAVRVTVLGLCVCLSVDAYSRTTGYKVAYKLYKRVQGLNNFS